jgi:hypothetical protein
VIFPVTQIRLPLYSFSGVPNWLRFSPQISTVNNGLGYGLSRLRNDGRPLVESASANCGPSWRHCSQPLKSIAAAHDQTIAKY